MRGNAPAILLLMIVPLKGPNGYNRSSERIAVWSFMRRESKAGDCPAFIFEDVILKKT